MNKICKTCPSFSKGAHHWPRKWYCRSLQQYFLQYKIDRANDDPVAWVHYMRRYQYSNRQISSYHPSFKRCIGLQRILDYVELLERVRKV